MSNRHLPAGQAMPGGGGPGGGGDAMVGGGGRRRMQQPPYGHAQHYQPYQQMHMYPPYMNSYPGGPYYPHPPHQYPNGGVPGYMPYQQQQQYVRSPQPMPSGYVPMAGVSVPPLYPQQPQPSPALSTQYQPPLASAAVPVQSPPPPHPQPQPVRQTPEFTVLKPVSKPLTPAAEPFKPAASVIQGPRVSQVDQAYEVAEVPEVSDGSRVDGQPQTQESELSPREGSRVDVAYQTLEPQLPSRVDVAYQPTEPELKEGIRAYWPPLPWTVPGQGPWPFPRQALKSRRRRRRVMPANAQNITLPVGQQDGILESENQAESASTTKISKETDAAMSENDLQKSGWDPKDTDSENLTQTAESAKSETLKGSVANISDLGSPKTTVSDGPKESGKSTASSSNASRHVVPVVPAVPVIPKSSPKETKADPVSVPTEDVKHVAGQEAKPVDSPETADAAGSGQDKAEAQPVAPPQAAPMKPWSSLFNKSGAAAKTQSNTNGPAATALVDGRTSNGVGAANGSTSNISENTLAAAIQEFRTGSLSKVQFIEPRGLENPANMCYMNSVLQVLLFCAPFYDFLDQVSKTVHRFKSETPVLDVMVLFMREFRVIESADSVEKLRNRLRMEQLEQFGEPFKPQFVYDAIKPLPKFVNIKQGAQQDAQEFLGLILEAIDEECRLVISTSGSTNGASGARRISSAGAVESNDDADEWQEVGQNQRPIETRSSRAKLPTPITRLFSGDYRSEVRRSGKQDSANHEPFQSLQLDIDSPYTNNVVDAIKSLTMVEKLNDDDSAGHFTKQIRIENLPPVLILHLKRFKFDAKGTTKIGKKIGYPLDLQLPMEALSKPLRNALGASLPKYRLISVVYHHSTQATSGHYTVDVRRQDGKEWIRLDDTNIRRVRSEDVAEAGAEEEPKDAFRKAASSREASTNRFGAMNDEDEGDWTKIKDKKSGAVVNGNSPTAPPKSKPAKDNIKDNKVAYLLFYQRV